MLEMKNYRNYHEHVEGWADRNSRIVIPIQIQSKASFEEEISPEELQELCNEEGLMDTASTTELSDVAGDSEDEEADEENSQELNPLGISLSSN